MATVLLGEFLVEKGFLTKLQLEEALQTQRVFAGRKLGELLVDRGFLSAADLEKALAMQAALRGQVQDVGKGEKAGLLGQIPILAELTGEELGELTALCRVETFVRGHLMFVEGEDGKDAFFLVKGSVRLVKSNPRGGEEELAVAGDGDMFGEAEIFAGSPRALSAYAQMDTTCVVLGKPELDALLERNPGLGVKLFRIFARSVAQRLGEALTRNVEDAGKIKSGKGFI